MKDAILNSIRRDPFLAMLCLGWMIMPWSNAIGQVPLYLASVCWVIVACRSRKVEPLLPMIFAACFAGLILLSLRGAEHAEQGIDKLNRFLYFPLPGAVLLMLRGGEPDKRIAFMKAYLIGCALMFLNDCIRIPIGMIRDGRSFFDMGNMSSPQFYMCGLVFAIALFVALPHEEWEWKGPGWLRKLCRVSLPSLPVGSWRWLLPMIMITAAGMLLHNKRGVWMAAALSTVIWMIWNRQWKLLRLTLLAFLVAIALPTVRARLSSIPDQWSSNHGSRGTLWKEVAPRMMERHPDGLGYNGSTYEEFREVLPREFHLEVGLRHLHNNYLQIRLELGWPGVILWSLWMLWFLIQSFRGPRSPLRSAASCALFALLINGIFEYNFGDSEVLMLYMTLFGLVLPPSPEDAELPLPTEA